MYVYVVSKIVVVVVVVVVVLLLPAGSAGTSPGASIVTCCGSC